MLCDRCGRPARAEDCAPVTLPGASGAGAVIRIHKDGCRALPHQSSPAPHPEHGR
ncbi:MAG TPA: hypothetical protein VFP69_06210 [Streptomyces sp.]|nr:hypothetical protein [Streptomyces sp.]